MPNRYWYIILTYVITQLSALAGAPLLVALGMGRYDAVAVWSVASFTIATIIILILLKPDLREEMTRSDRSSAGSVVLWSIAGVFLALFAQAIAATIESQLFDVPAGSENTMGLMEIARQSPLFILLPVVFAPITEEILFRKIIFGSIYKRTNFFLAVLVSSLIFGAFHFDFTHMLVYFSMGVVFAFLYVKTKRIITPIVAHMAMNSFVVITQYFLTEEDIRRMQEQLETIFIGGFL
ncbi:type II CAAX endopeptidase family protein [Halobacillus sp. ACCC02827]|uniref:CPBP family intramembrane glutamic endopeptidase n=1 Tax=Bacillaceae TaxID=186817 RepID=UPI0002A4F65F|nr:MULTISPECIES: type II CAAX endopeptidase family protein [Bacillaceae]ELK45806.1 membrane peptidase YdiL [Halobacillus sp. BAB-2008]QHT45405.1 CPBP family intramembrane metalloprotease [Bacillus sp. SB49]WJE16194.1 type II CAAX endopeptidase family protein [Halobacillus sp. ACCC02827]